MGTEAVAAPRAHHSGGAWTGPLPCGEVRPPAGCPRAACSCIAMAPPGSYRCVIGVKHGGLFSCASPSCLSKEWELKIQGAGEGELGLSLGSA